MKEDPDADGQRFTFNLRFAGQYFDAESALHYNGYRDYDPATGRYVQGDPIGLSGGISLYGYVSVNPLTFLDPLGLAGCPSSVKQTITARATDNSGAVTATLYFVHPDHLGTPRLISNQAGTTVWRWDNQEAFGLTGLQMAKGRAVTRRAQ